MSSRFDARLVCLVALLLLACSPLLAGFRTVSWDASAGATGYRVHYGDASRGYSESVDVGNTTVVTLNEDLDDCTTWYFAVTAYNSVGESGYSEEADWLTPMGVDSVTADTPGQVLAQGAQFGMTLRGAGFAQGATITVDQLNWTCAGYAEQAECQSFLDDLRSTVQITVDQQRPVTCNEIPVWATFGPVTSGAMPALSVDAPPSDRRYIITVTNPDDTSTEFIYEPDILTDQQRFNVATTPAATANRMDGEDWYRIWRSFAACKWPGTAARPCCPAGQSEQQFQQCKQAHAEHPYDPARDFDGDGWIDMSDLAWIAPYMDPGNPDKPDDPATQDDLMGGCWNQNEERWDVSACN